MREELAQSAMIARDLLEAQKTRRTFTPIRSNREPIGLPLAYAAQRHVVQAYIDRGDGVPIGYKVGLTNPAMWAMAGVNQPIAGVVLGGRALSSPAVLSNAQFVRLGIESEMAVRIARRLPTGAARKDKAAIAQCIDRIYAAFEIVEDRDADYAQLDAASIVAENSWNAGIVLGEGIPISGAEALEGLTGALYVDGEHVQSGSSNDVLGHPCNVVGWLADHLDQAGEALAPGQIVMTGAIVPTKFPRPGQTFRFEIDGLPPVELQIDP